MNIQLEIVLNAYKEHCKTTIPIMKKLEEGITTIYCLVTLYKNSEKKRQKKTCFWLIIYKSIYILI